jgi:GNAT superfamily N-acetyltransferase
MISYNVQSEEYSSLGKTAEMLNYVMNKKHFSANYLKWEYFDNPVGKALTQNAYEDGKLIGHYGAQPIISKINGEIYRGLFILNAAVMPDFQGKGILRTLVENLHDFAGKNKFSFIIGVGNKNSAPIYTKKFGFRSLGATDVKIGFGLPRAGMKGEVFFERIWDEESLRWRLKNPNTKYSSSSKNNQTVLFTRNYPGLSTIMGMFREPGLDLDSLTNDKYPGINIFIGKDPAIDWKQNRSFITFPEALKPSPLVMIFKELNNNSFPFTSDEIKFRCIDFDAF